MLSVMREWFHGLKILLWLVVASFVITTFWVWGGAREAARAGLGASWAARVEGETIPATSFMQRVRNLDNFYRRLYGAGYAQQRPSLRLGDTVIRDLVDSRLIGREADRLGLGATLDDLTRFITGLPEFQGPDGRFIGRQRYEELLRSNGLDVHAFESEQLEQLTVSRFKNAVYDALSMSDRELDEEALRRNEKSSVAVLRIPAARFQPAAAPSDAELQAHLEKHPERFRLGESRRGRSLTLEREKVAAEVKVPEEELRQQYERDLQSRYTRQEQRRASHILFKIDAAATPADVEKVRQRAEKVLAQARAGGNFDELARRDSEDTGSAPQGGDLGFFARGAMVAEFESEAFGLPVGEISGLVRSSFGFHIIKATGSQPPGVMPFEETRAGIERALSFQRVQEEMMRRARTWTERLRAGDTLDEIAGEERIEIRDTGFLRRDERGGGATEAMVQALFALAADGASEPMAVPEGLAVVQMADSRPASVPPLAEARSAVEADWKRSAATQAGRGALERAGLYSASPPAPQAAARSLSGQVVEAGPFTRLETPATVPATLQAAAFAIPPGAWSEPIVDGDDLVALRVVQRPPLDEPALRALRDSLRSSLLFQKRNLLYTRILEELRARAEIEINQPLVDQIDRG